MENNTENRELDAKLKELLSDDEISTRIKGCTSLEEVCKVLSEKNVQISTEELKAFLEKSGFLTDKELDDVAGGWVFDMYFREQQWKQYQYEQKFGKISY